MQTVAASDILARAPCHRHRESVRARVRAAHDVLARVHLQVPPLSYASTAMVIKAPVGLASDVSYHIISRVYRIMLNLAPIDQ